MRRRIAENTERETKILMKKKQKPGRMRKEFAWIGAGRTTSEEYFARAERWPITSRKRSSIAQKPV
jgi:hypothetical protein